ncbi:unnamed protein product [Brachionus calyciflorus]|uniref:Uncharacterized protein n=1 Tax=Brachionus calyciflorus TaxID=104777 RepID=A0A813M3J0_9BILA|nr:unnamed protein product [Brachionus calyciflorus]
MDEFVTFPFPTAAPALPANVYLPLTIVLLLLYSFIFVIVYIQLFLIWYNKHKRFSYQTVFLFMSLIWSSLRISLFSFYFKNAEDANKLVFVLYFCLYCLPVVVQFCTLCLLVLYYGEVYFKIATRNNKDKNNLMLRIAISISIAIFLVTSLLSAYYVREICTLRKKGANCNIYQVTLIRILITDLLFVIIGFMLSFYLFKLARLSMNYSIPEQNNITLLKSTVVSACTSFLLISRTLYNIIAITLDKLKLPDFNFDWINVSDQADLVNLTEAKKYISFVVVLLIWELIPTFVIVVLFRLKQEKPTNEVILGINSNSINDKSVFLDSNSYDYSIQSYEYDFNPNYRETGPIERENLIKTGRNRNYSSINNY